MKGKERRKLRRQRRKMRRGLAKKFFESLAQGQFVQIRSFEDFLENMEVVWPTIDRGLEFAISLPLTGKRSDRALQALLDLGRRIRSGEAQNGDVDRFIANFGMAFEAIEFALEIAIDFVENEKVDDILEEVLEAVRRLMEPEDAEPEDMDEEIRPETD